MILHNCGQLSIATVNAILIEQHVNLVCDGLLYTCFVMEKVHTIDMTDINLCRACLL